MSMESILTIKDLAVSFSTPDGEIRAVNGVNLEVGAGECVGIVGESGSGKSQIFMSVMGLLASNGKLEGSASFYDQNLFALDRKSLNRIRGNRISMIFQDPMTCLTPHVKIGTQMTEVLTYHQGMDQQEAKTKAISMLDRVRIPEAAKRFEMYPHECSGGMRQRVMIAMSLLCDPELIIADEPTTALDVTVQADILDLINEIRSDSNTAIVLVTHDLGVVAKLCDRVKVMYAGRFVESAGVEDLFENPSHPYTQGLLNSMPRLVNSVDEVLPIVPGQPPNLLHLPNGCSFSPRCLQATEACNQASPMLSNIAETHEAACFLLGERENEYV